MIKREGIIEIRYLEFDDNSEENIKNYMEKNTPIPKIKGFCVDFEGWNEGSGSPCKNEQEVKEEVDWLIKKHQKEYNLRIVDKRIKQKTLI